MYELELPSLNAVNDMTWREFQLRKAGYEREQLRKDHRTREAAYWSGAGTAFDHSKMSIQKFMPLGNDADKPIFSEEHQASFKKAMEVYKNKVKSKNVDS